MLTWLTLTLTFALLFAAGAMWVMRIPTRRTCPICAHTTQPLVAPLWLLPFDRWLGLRWCPDCNWQAVGRKGPDWIPGKQVAHDSGFHWGDDVAGENLGFRWAQPQQVEPSPEPPSHPSGFRFAAAPPPPGSVRKPSHPSGFVWGGGGRPPPARRKAPAPPSARRFRFKDGG